MVEATTPRPRRDPFNDPPLVPTDWRLLRALVQFILAVLLLFGPSALLSPPITRSTLGVYGVPWVLIGVGWCLRRHVSRVAGTLLAVGMVVHLVAWVAIYIYAWWLFRGLHDEFSMAAAGVVLSVLCSVPS